MTDLILPKVNGFELANKIGAIDPKIKLIFISGYNQDILEKHEIPKSDIIFIQKPIYLQDLAKKLREALSKN